MGVIDSSLPLAPDNTEWDSAEAKSSVKALATNKDGTLNWGIYKKAFFYVVDGGGDKQGDYSLPFATVIDGEIKAVWSGVAAAMGALNGAHGGDPIPAPDKEAVYHEICTYYKRFDKEPPELKKSITLDIGDHVNMLTAFEPDSVKDLGGGAFTATVTTSDIDRTGETIATGGISTDSYMNNPVVLYGHDYQSLPIGKCTKITAFKNKLVATFQLAVNEYPFAKTVADMIKGGYLNAVSIGGVVKQMSQDFSSIEAMEMVEFSVVPVPANANALITARSLFDTTGKSTEQIAKEYKDFVREASIDKIKALDNSDIDNYIKSLEEVTAILKSAQIEKASDTPKTKIVIRKAAAQISYDSQQFIRLIKAKE